jgi:hypothetical protein
MIKTLNSPKDTPKSENSSQIPAKKAKSGANIQPQQSRYIIKTLNSPKETQKAKFTAKKQPKKRNQELKSNLSSVYECLTN